jgi:hypothetical protein
MRRVDKAMLGMKDLSKDDKLTGSLEHSTLQLRLSMSLIGGRTM